MNSCRGLLPRGKRLGEHAGRRVGRKPVDGLLGHARQPAKLAEAPVVHRERLVVAGVEHQASRSVLTGLAQSVCGRLPDFQRLLLLPLAVLREHRQRRKALVRRPPEQFVGRTRQITHDLSFLM